MVRRSAPAIHPSSRSRLSTAGADALFLPATRSVQLAAGTAATNGLSGSDAHEDPHTLLMLGAGASGQTLGDLKKDGNGGSTDNILTYGMGYHQQRYSPLKEINKQTVKRLVPVWNLSLDNNWGEQAQ